MTSNDQTSAHADEVMRLIGEDIAAGHVPATVASFSELHDYVDANEYALEAAPFSGPPCTCVRTVTDPACYCEHYDAWCAYTDYLNDVETEADRRIKAGAFRS